jgi:signal transduction histidine kinase
MIAYVVSIFLNFVFLRYFGMIGVVSAIVLDLALLLYLLRDRLGKLSVRAGLRELSKGKLDYRIDTGSLTGDSLEMAQAVNEMGDGLQEAVDTMVRSERLKAELITNLSHDLKTPLTSIINYVDLLKRENPENERQRQYIEVLERKSMRLKSLITDLIDVSRISSGNVELHMAKLDLRPMVQMAAGEFEDRFEQIPLTVQMEAKKSLPVMADGDMLWRVFDNLLGNIAKYAKP